MAASEKKKKLVILVKLSTKKAIIVFLFFNAHLLDKSFTSQKMKFSIKDFFSKCDQIRRKVQIWSHLLHKSLMENFTFCAVFLSVIKKFAFRRNQTINLQCKSFNWVLPNSSFHWGIIEQSTITGKEL